MRVLLKHSWIRCFFWCEFKIKHRLTFKYKYIQSTILTYCFFKLPKFKNKLIIYIQMTMNNWTNKNCQYLKKNDYLLVKLKKPPMTFFASEGSATLINVSLLRLFHAWMIPAHVRPMDRIIFVVCKSFLFSFMYFCPL